MDVLRLLALTALTVVLGLVVLPGADSWSGPVLLSLTTTHGVHLADLSVVGLTALVLLQAQRSLRPAAAG